MCRYRETNGDCSGEIDILLVKEGNACKWSIAGASTQRGQCGAAWEELGNRNIDERLCERQVQSRIKHDEG